MDGRFCTEQGIEPNIWRRIQVPGKYSFGDLHVAIQYAMGWFDCHLHAFRLEPKHGRKVIKTGIPMGDMDDLDIHPGRERSHTLQVSVCLPWRRF